ncbi:hypothetical protein [Robertmurraya sp. Marseille-Q9965]
MSKELVQEKEFDITELVEALSLEDELKLDKDIRGWLQTPPVQLKDYGYEPDSEQEYFAFLNKISNYHLTER